MDDETLRQHLISRGVDLCKYKPYIGDSVATFMLYTPAKKLVGYQQYRPESDKKKRNDPKDCRYYTYLPSQTDGFFGFEQDNGLGRLYIVEGIFKAIALHNIGVNAIAVLGATPKRLRPTFKIWRATRELYAIGDNDSAGRELVKYVKRGVQSPIDIDEMSNLKEWVEDNCR